MYMASLDVKMASDVARPSVVSKILSVIGTHGQRGGRFAGRDAGRARVRMLRELRDGFPLFQVHTQGGVEAPVLWGRVTKYVLWKAEERWKVRGWGLSFGWRVNLTTIAECDVGGQLLAILPQSGDFGPW